MTGRVVVGVDLDDASAVALREAVREARWRGAALEIVHVHHPATAATAFPVPAGRGKDRPDPEGVRRRAAEALDTWLDTVDVDLTDLEVTRVLRGARHPGRELEALGRGAALVVVGTRRRPAIATSLLGSVGEHLARRCPAPVLHTRS
ncbi:universal stress protein [Rhabdothermincola salaria]|uniref:universal stress protein n=1 Tax=Rhabdothermincola salaria TaxID=2903142 RepID=UPI001E40E422|nr:universal stress protein [Rhabdothermincola salaria]MCD9625084.1 universal stress protein [Rhabdothermincola salaria]